MNQSKVPIVAFCGLPGVGKSTLLERFRETGALQNCLGDQTRVVYVSEAVDEWRTRGWLDAYYRDPSRYAAAFQFMAFDSHVRSVEDAIHQATPGTLLVTERSMYDQRLFWSVQVDMQHETADDFYDAAYLTQWTRWKRFIPEPAHIFHLETSSLESTMQRVAHRDRGEERSGLTTEYQRRLRDKHHQWYQHGVAAPPGGPEEGIPCTLVNADGDWNISDTELMRIARQVADAVKK